MNGARGSIASGAAMYLACPASWVALCKVSGAARHDIETDIKVPPSVVETTGEDRERGQPREDVTSSTKPPSDCAATNRRSDTSGSALWGPVIRAVARRRHPVSSISRRRNVERGQRAVPSSADLRICGAVSSSASGALAQAFKLEVASMAARGIMDHLHGQATTRMPRDCRPAIVATLQIHSRCFFESGKML